MITINSPAQPTLRVIVLAAGFATRLGQPKALARVQGSTLLERLLATLRPWVPASAIVVIAPPRAARTVQLAASKRVKTVPNARRAGGLSSSVRLGLRHARHCAAVLILPVDLIDLTRRDVERLVRRWQGCRRKVVASRVADAAATPLILPRWLVGEASRLQGDEGLRSVVRRLAKCRIALVAMPGAASDIDTPGDLQRARRRYRGYVRGVCTNR